MDAHLMTGEHRIIYTPFSPAEGNAQSRGELVSANAAITRDYWDTRPSREANLVQLLKTRLPKREVRNLTPILDEIRAVKTPREVALIRRASQLAGRGLIEAMKSTRPGVYEYQLDAAARYVFLVNGAAWRATAPSPRRGLRTSGTCTTTATSTVSSRETWY